MNALKKEKFRNLLRNCILPLLISICVLAAMLWGSYRYDLIQKEQNRQLTVTALKKASVQCYADEGSYPNNVDYLIEKYNVDVDFDSFNVVYDCIAANISPTIEVYVK